jgi:hypothetical protein
MLLVSGKRLKGNAVTQSITRMVASSGAVAMLALGGAAPAMAAKRHSRSHAKHATHHAANSSTTSSSTTSSSTTGSTTTGNGETALTGTNLSSASSAALAAVPGGTVDRASTETDSSNSSAAYEVHVAKSDGTHVLVLEDTSFAVLSVTAETGGCSRGVPGGAAGSGA